MIIEICIKILNFYQDFNYRGETIDQIIENYLLKWKIDKVLIVAIGNGSSNNLTIVYLKNMIQD